MRVLIQEETNELARAAAAETVSTLAAAIAERGHATWVLAGGTSPLASYRELASQYGTSLDWSRVVGIIGDERCVPLDHEDSNTRQVLEAMRTSALKDVNVLIPRHLDTPAECARDYSAQIRAAMSEAGVSVFTPDLVWLGMGEDGHTLSHFPASASLDDERDLVTYIRDSPKPPADRITLSVGAVSTARRVLVFAVGSGKRDALHAVIRSAESRPIGAVCARIQAAGGEVEWLADAAALVPSAG